MTRHAILGAAILAFAPLAAKAADADLQHFPVKTAPPPTLGLPMGGASPFSAAVLAGRTLYVSGAIDMDPMTGKIAVDADRGATVALDSMKKTVEAAGMSMDDLVWVQVFCSDLSNFGAFNRVYVTYFKGPLPARAFIGVDHLLANAHFEVMGVAVEKP